MATAPIQPLAWEPPYAAGAAQEIATITTTTTTITTTTKKRQKNESEGGFGVGVVWFWPCLWHVKVPWVRDGTQATAAIPATAVTMPDP